MSGRAAGEMADIFYDAVIKSGVRKEDVEIIYSEDRAIEKAILDAMPGDIIVVFYEDFELAAEVVERMRTEISRNKAASEAVIQNVG